MQGQSPLTVLVALGLLAVAGLTVGLGTLLGALWLYDQFTRKPPPEKPFDTL